MEDFRNNTPPTAFFHYTLRVRCSIFEHDPLRGHDNLRKSFPLCRHLQFFKLYRVMREGGNLLLSGTVDIFDMQVILDEMEK